MKHDFKYISKRSPQVSAAYEDLMLLLKEVRKELRKDYTFQHRIVGSYARDMITYDTKSNVGYDFDVNIYPNDDDDEFTAKQLKLKFKNALDKCASAHGFAPAEDSTRVLTIKIKDPKRSRIVFSIDFAFVNDYTDEDGKEHQEYIHNDKKGRNYSWCEQPQGYYLLPEKIQWIKDNNLWAGIRSLYIEKKNKNNDEHCHSRTIFAQTVHEVCQKNGFYESDNCGNDDDDDYWD